jgi:hypothetical protein
VILDKDKVLKEGTPRCAETIELQHIFGIPKDGYFGKHTELGLIKKYGRVGITLHELSELGVKVRDIVPENEIWWLQIK